MNETTDQALLSMFYSTTYDFLLKNPGFDGTPHPDHPGMARTGGDPAMIKPWPGVADVPHQSRDEWIAARLAAVRNGVEESPLRLKGSGRR